MEKRQQLTIAIVAGVAALLIIGGVAWHRSSNSVEVDLSNATPPEQAAVEAPKDGTAAPAPVAEAPKDGTPAPAPAPAPTTPSATSSYAAALKIYGASGYRYQFLNCRGTPGKLTVKRGQKFMIDNRDPKAHVFKLESKSFTVGKLGFAIVSSSAAGIHPIFCDGVHAADLNVQR